MRKDLKQIAIAVILPKLKRGFTITLLLSIFIFVISIIIMSVFEIIEIGLPLLGISIIGIYISNIKDWSKRDGSIILKHELIERLENDGNSIIMQISDISEITFIYRSNAETMTYALSTGGIHNYLTIIDINKNIKEYHVFIKSNRQAKYITQILENYKSQGVSIILKK
jgi:hypothetical protein